MPFCRKCGRCLPPYSKICYECKTSTTGPLINIKKASTVKSFKVATPIKIAKAIVPIKANAISIQVIDPTKLANAVNLAKIFNNANSNIPSVYSKLATASKIYPTHKIKQSNLSLKEDIVTNPNDYETQTFSFDLQCLNNHFWPANKALPISNGKACCPKCGEPLRKPKPKKRHRTSEY